MFPRKKLKTLIFYHVVAKIGNTLDCSHPFPKCTDFRSALAVAYAPEHVLLIVLWHESENVSYYLQYSSIGICYANAFLQACYHFALKSENLEFTKGRSANQRLLLGSKTSRTSLGFKNKNRFLISQK